MMILSLLIVLTAIFATVTPFWTNLELQSIENIKGDASLPAIADVKSKRVRKGVYGISGTLTFNDDMSKYTADVEVYYSAKGNGEWTKTPVSVPPGPLCDKLNMEYRKFVMKPMAKASDMPDSDTGDMCSIIEQKTYTINGYELEEENIPKFLQSGVYKVIIFLRPTATPNDVTSELHVIVKLS